MPAPLSFLLLLLMYSGQLSATTRRECCNEKLSYTDDGQIEMFVLVPEQENGADCEDGCVFVRCFSLVLLLFILSLFSCPMSIVVAVVLVVFYVLLFLSLGT